ncbi:flagellar inner arm dynein 1 heavy chain alpha, partial [Haematococcus lacustris]
EVKYHTWLEGLDLMLQRYYQVTGQLTSIEQELMAKKLEELECSLLPGFQTLNWNSLGIPEFIQACQKSINNFQQVVKQVQKNSGIIEKVVYAIAGASIVTDPAAAAGGSSELLDLQELYELVEKGRIEAIERLVKKYHTISPLLGKIEEVVAGTNTGKSPQLTGYYAFWERAIFNALNAMVLNAMGSLQAMIDARSKRTAALNAKNADKNAVARQRRPPPLFKITVSLQSSDIVVQPPVAEVNKALGRLVRSLVESTKPFVRWMDGTCIETPEQKGANDDDEPVVFTFYWDVAGNPQVIKSMLMLNQSIQRAISGINRYIESWRRHQSLWKTDKSSVLDKFKASDPPCAAFEEKLAKYTK